MKRAISVYLPTWSTDLLRRRLGNSAPSADTPIAVIANDGNSRIVTSVDRAARLKGVTIGMPATQAMAMVNGLYCAEADHTGDASVLQKLGLNAIKHYSPRISLDSDGLYIDATGVPHLFGGERHMLIDIGSRLKRAGYSCRLAIAPTYGAAHALARFAVKKVTIADLNDLESLLGKLPPRALRLSDDALADLNKLGFETIASIKAAPRSAMTLRFGKEISQRIDQAFGELAEPCIPLVPLDLDIVSRVFGDPIGSPEALQYHTILLAQQLCQQLDEKRMGARCADLLFHRVDNKIEVIRIGLAKPMQDAKRLAKLLCLKLDTIDPGCGVELMALSAPWVEPLQPKQTSSLLDGNRVELASLYDTLGNRLPAGSLYRMTNVESDVPERSQTKVNAIEPTPRSHWPSGWPRPVRLFPRPQPIDTIALLPDHPPVSFTWRGSRHRVRRADGPERIFGEWWRRDSEFEAVRDYFQVEDEAGERFWLFRQGDGVTTESGSQRWFIHGLFA